VRIDLAWGARESNQVGTDEFLQYCERLGTAPYVCVNLGTGSLDEARNWVEYCNIEKGTYWSDLRRKNGREQPYRVKYWGLGNEMDGSWQMGHKNADDYGKYALEAAKLMKWIDPSIKLIVSGSSDYGGDWIHWNRTVLNYLKDHTDYISLHRYVGNPDNDFYKYMTVTIPAEQSIRIVENQIREVMTKSGRKEPIYIAFDEYNVWYRAGAREQYEEQYTLEDALVIAQFLNVFVRNAQVVKMANMAQLVNILAPMITSSQGLFYQTIFYPMALFANNTKGTALQAYVDGPTFSTDKYKDNPFLDVSVSFVAADKLLVINVVNRHKDQTVATDIISQNGPFTGKATVHEVNGKDIKDVNDMQVQRVKPVQKEIPVKGNTLTYSFPAHSFTQILMHVE
jgi:alpha-N-arabinofuranosidase